MRGISALSISKSQGVALS